MAFKSILFIVLTTKLCLIDNTLGIYIDAGCVNSYDIGHYKLSAVPRFRRDLNDLEFINTREPAGFIPEYLRIFDNLMPNMKNKMEIIKGNILIPRTSENQSSEGVPPSFVESEQPDSSRGGYVNEIERDTYHGLNIRPETALTEGPIIVDNATPDSFLVRETGDQIDWKKGGEDEVALNANSDIYKLVQDMDLKSREEIFNLNQMDTDSPDVMGATGCYNQCLQNCYGSSSTGFRPHCGSSRQAKPLIININSECFTHPSQRFNHRYHFKPKFNMNTLKFRSLPKKIFKYSSCPLSEIPPFY